MKPVTLQSAPRCRKWWGGSAWSAFWLTPRSRSSAELGRDDYAARRAQIATHS
jgi:hypothetical protein